MLNKIFDYKEIPLTQNKIALVDIEDYKKISAFKWQANKQHGVWYAIRTGPRHGKNKKRKHVKMHRLIMNAQVNEQVDHKNGNGLDNRRQNLRFCTTQQNGMNRKKNKNCSSQYKGVCFYKWAKYECWMAAIKYNQKRIHIGCYKTEIEAAKAYDKKAKELFGEFARLNFPEEIK